MSGVTTAGTGATIGVTDATTDWLGRTAPRESAPNDASERSDRIDRKGHTGRRDPSVPNDRIGPRGLSARCGADVDAIGFERAGP